MRTVSTSARIGIITGSGPEAGIDLWNKILQANRALQGERFRGDLDAPNVTVFSEPALGLSMELAENDAAVWTCLKAAAEAISQRVDYYAIACNTLNYYQPQLDALGLKAKLVSFADVVAAFLRQHRIARVALLGARPVTDLGPWSHYSRLAEHVDVEQPDAAMANVLHQLIYDVKTFGGESPDMQRRFQAIVDGLQADTVLLACTELPLIPPPQTGKRIVDVTELVARELARLANAGRQLTRSQQDD